MNERGDGQASWMKRPPVGVDLRGAVQLARARPDFLAGLRAATATIFPLFFAELHGHFEFVWMALGGWLATLSDPGGAYQTRARSMGAFTAAAALSVAGAALAGGRLWLAAPLLFLWGGGTSAARVYGDAAATVGVLVLITFCIALGSPPVSTEAAEVRLAFFLAGACVAMVLSLGLWPVRAYQPAREAVARCYRALAAYLRALREASSAAQREERFAWLAREERPILRERIEGARAALATVRRGRQSETARGEQLLVLLEAADLCLGTAGALTEALHGGGRQAESVLRAAESACAAIAESIVAGREAPKVSLGVAAPLAGGDEVALLLRHLDRELQAAAEAADILVGENPRLPARPRSPPSAALAPPSPALRDALRPGSLVLRHALRVATTTTAGLLLGAALGRIRSHWITVTIVIVLQPTPGATLRKALQRVVGTLVGATTASLLAPFLHTPLSIAAVLFPFTVAGVAVRSLNYGLFATLITPVFVLMAETVAGDFHLASVRITNNLIGGGVALLGTFLLWPSWEREQLPMQLATLLDRLRAYVAEVARASGANGGAAQVVAARRSIGLSAANADASLQRFLGEPHEAARVEPAMVILVYARRLSAAITALWAAHTDPAVARAMRERAPLLEASLAALSRAARQGSPPLPETGSPKSSAPHPPQLERIEAHLAVLRNAVARFSGAGGP